MRRSTKELYSQFYYRSNECLWTLKNARKARLAGQLTRRDVATIYDGAFLSAVTSFEGFLEDLCLSLLTDRFRHIRYVSPYARFPNKVIARTVLTHGRSYLDWLPLDKTISRSKSLFRDSGNPFHSLTAPQKASVHRVVLVRNYIAHESEHSELLYKREVLGNIALPAGQNDRLGYFSYAHGVGLSKIEFHIAELHRVAHSLTH